MGAPLSLDDLEDFSPHVRRDVVMMEGIMIWTYIAMIGTMSLIALRIVLGAVWG